MYSSWHDARRRCSSLTGSARARTDRATVHQPRFRGNVTVMHDDETQRVLRDVVGNEHAIPERLRGRLRGETIAELRKDAQVLARELGIAPEQPRDEHGRFETMDALIRGGGRRR
jgi:hypothetical protein